MRPCEDIHELKAREGEGTHELKAGEGEAL